MKNGVAIKYGDIALGAKENFAPAMSNIEPFSNVSILKENNASFANYGNPMEKYSVLLDGSSIPFPSETQGKNFGIWSSVLSDDDGYFEIPLVLSLKATELFTSSGITVTFDDVQGVFPTEAIVSWYRGDEKIEEQEFQPNSGKYFFNKKVEYYDGVEFQFLRLNMPQNRLKIHSVDYGIGVIFYGDELRYTKLSQSIDPISTQIEINTCDFEIYSKKNVEYSFQTQQPISVYFDGKLKATCFVNNAKRSSLKSWRVQTEDYIGLMDSIPYNGGMYFEKNAEEIIADIFAVAKVPYELEENFIGVKVSGHIPYTTCRDAIMQVAFAIGAVVDTAGIEFVKIYSLPNEVSQEIQDKRVVKGQTISEKNIVTAVEMTSHFYIPTQEQIVAYDSVEGGVGENIFVAFDEPLHSLSISNGQILSSGANHAIINAYDGCSLAGLKYQHVTTTKTKRNPLVSPNDIENVVSIQGATLVSKSNIDNLLSSCYNYIVNAKDLKMKIIDGKSVKDGVPIRYGEKRYGQFKYAATNDVVTYDMPTKVGDVVVVPLEFLGNAQARIVKQTFSLGGGIIVKNSELR